VAFDDLPRFPTRDLGDSLVVIVEQLRAAGSAQLLAVDLTHPDVAVPVVKVIVPGRATDVEALG
jgi:ribosomal protein S12 methylthiotransferase accessory factor